MRIFCREDYDMADTFLDMPPQQSRSLIRQMGIDGEYFLAVPSEPNAVELANARRVLYTMLDYQPMALMS
jgi:hypothetical protein